MDPIFKAGSSHSAVIPVTVEPAGLPCQLELYLTRDGGATKAATSGLKSFTSTGNPQNVSTGALAMPTDGVGYDVYIDVYTGGILIGAYISSEKVTIPSVGITEPSWE
jgi:hypothetical protein